MCSPLLWLVYGLLIAHLLSHTLCVHRVLMLQCSSRCVVVLLRCCARVTLSCLLLCSLSLQR